MTQDNKYAWTTLDELNAITYMGSDAERIGCKKVPTVIERKQKLMAWINTASKRVWPANIDVNKCRAHADELYAAL